ncbi:hypothetical protein CBS101457_006232 [Exobasidium rhododendri]|nr:hypothetical protein CBS101457_006232 [Exobasidium rhododendri]
MNTAKNFLSNITSGGTEYRGNGGGPGMAENKSRFGMGIGNTGALPSSTAGNATSGYLGGPWGEDRITNIAIIVRGFQVLCSFCFLIVVIVLATFQTKWIGAISGLTGILLIVNILTFLFSAFLLAVSFLPDSLQTSGDRIIKTMEQPRLALVMNSFGLVIWFILSITQTASALSSAACKDPSSDAHAKTSKGNDDDFIKALPSFCSTKKAGAAFCWLIWLTCVATMLLFLRFWKLSRKNGPRIPPFVHSGGEGDFQPIADDFDGEGDEYGQTQFSDNATSNRYGDGGDGSNASYGGGGGGRGVAAGQGVYENTRIPYDSGGNPPAGFTRTDPFADSNYIPRQSYDYGAYGAPQTPSDPYAAIQQQLRSDRAPQLPPLYRG